MSSPPHPAPVRRRAFGLVVAAASVPMFMATLDNLVMTNALPVLHEQLGATRRRAAVVRQRLHAGVRERDPHRVGARRPVRPAHGLHRSASRSSASARVLAALSTDPRQLIAARALQGFGGAGVLPLSLALISGGVAPERRPLAIGIWGGISGLGVAVGPLVGGAVMEGWNWQAIFWINVPVAIIAIPLALFVLNNDFGARARIDVVGAVLAGGRRARPRARDRPRQRRRLGLGRRDRRDRRRRRRCSSRSCCGRRARRRRSCRCGCSATARSR